MLELDKKLGEHPNKNSDEYKEYASFREKLDYEVYKNNNEKFAKMFPNMKENTLSFEEWKDRAKENAEKSKKEEAKEEKKQEDFDNILQILIQLRGIWLIILRRMKVGISMNIKTVMFKMKLLRNLVQKLENLLKNMERVIPFL